VPCRSKHGPRCGPGHVARRAEILGTARPSCSCRIGTTQNISCRAVLRVVLKDRAMTTRPQRARPKSQLYSAAKRDGDRSKRARARAIKSGYCTCATKSCRNGDALSSGRSCSPHEILASVQRSREVRAPKRFDHPATDARSWRLPSAAPLAEVRCLSIDRSWRRSCLHMPSSRSLARCLALHNVSMHFACVQQEEYLRLAGASLVQRFRSRQRGRQRQGQDLSRGEGV
jgi:hypothetical protein